MPNLLNESPAAREWADSAIQRHTGDIFGELKPGVIWSDARGSDGELLVQADPVDLAAKINNDPLIVLHTHDPGRPLGQVLEAAHFQTEGGSDFVVAIFGFYANGDVLSFGRVGIDTGAIVPPPARLPALPTGIWIQVATDPRDAEPAWLEKIIKDAPIRVERTAASYNEASSTAQQLITVGVAFLVMVWNPFVTEIAKEAGKDAYPAVRNWLRNVLENLAGLRNPVLEVAAWQDGCKVSFLFRGKNIQEHLAAHDIQAAAAAQAAQFIANLKARGMPVRRLVYEFDREAVRWIPSYAILNDHRLITDSVVLIAIEHLPPGLSLGLGNGEALFPVVRPVADDDNS